MLTSAQQAEAEYEKRKKKQGPDGALYYNPKALYQVYKKRTESIPYTQVGDPRQAQDSTAFMLQQYLEASPAGTVPAGNCSGNNKSLVPCHLSGKLVWHLHRTSSVVLFCRMITRPASKFSQSCTGLWTACSTA